ncbi:MAG TPA: MFS transporter [Candidatus Acidoferrum sp.]|nr:MFS transporter [Candidatus Acidoferrum sp.]
MVTLLLGIGWAVFNLVFNLYMSALGFSNAVIGVFNSLPAVALLFVGLPLAAIADRIGYRIFLLAGEAVAIGASLVLSAVGVRLIAVLAAGTYALAIIVIQVLGSPLLAQISSEAERLTLFALSASLTWIASLFGSLLGGVIPEIDARFTHASSSSATTIRVAFTATLLLTLLSLPFLLRLARSASLRPVTVFPIRQLLHVDVGRFARLLLPNLLLGIGAGMYLNFVQLYLSQRFGLTPGPIGVILGVGSGLTAAVTLAAPRIGRLFGLSRSVGLLQILGSPLVLALAFLMNLPVAVGILYARQLALNLQGPLGQVFAMEYVDPRQRARLTTAIIVVNGVGVGGIGPLASGFLQVSGGYQLAFSVSAAFYLLAGLTFLFLFGGVRLLSERPS